MRLSPLLALLLACGGPRFEPAPDAGEAPPPLADAGEAPPLADAGEAPPLADAGAPRPSPALVPASVTIPAQVGRAPAPALVELRNAGDAPLDWTASCTGVTASPDHGQLAAGDRVPVTLAAPLPLQAGEVAASCAIAGLQLAITIDAHAQPGVGYEGGSVDLLDFVFTGDTRPEVCDDLPGYPSEILRQEVLQMSATSAQFALDLGDHMQSCINLAASARAQMDRYVAAVSLFPRPFFMTMGNHECGTALDCTGAAATRDNNFKTYLPALQAVSRKALPYYAFDVQTRLGLARFVFIADNVRAEAWAEDVLADADKHAALVIIAKHHPVSGSRRGPLWSNALIARHKATAILTAHEHVYRHDPTAFEGRSVVCGLGGASTRDTGFCRLQQQGDGSLRFTRYDLSANPLDSWTIAP